MYGFSGYATNTYASRRFLGTLAPVIRIRTSTLQLGFRPLVQPIRIIQNDYGYQIPFILNDSDGNPVDLDGAALSLKVQSSQDPTDTLLTATGAMEIDSSPTGACHYLVGLGDFPSTGTFLGQITANYGGEIVTWGGFQIIVAPALPKDNN